MTTLRYTHFDTELGPVLVAATEQGICLLQIPSFAPDLALQTLARARGVDKTVLDRSGLREVEEDLRRHLSGEPVAWTCPLDVRGTDFQRRVWDVVRAIPYGETRSYAAVARSIGNPRSVRAVGAANGANPLQIIIPCHRVVGTNGALVGYGGGLETKRRLLEIEASRLPLAI